MNNDRPYYSQRNGSIENSRYNLETFRELFGKVFHKLQNEGYFQKYLGTNCTNGYFEGLLGADVELELLLKLGKRSLWPVWQYEKYYSEEDIFDLIEFLYDHSAKGLEGDYHSWNDCGIHYKSFHDAAGRDYVRTTINRILKSYGDGFELSENGEVLKVADDAFKTLLEAPVVAEDIENINARLQRAIVKFRKAKSTAEDRKDALRELADILEFLKSDVQQYLDNQDAKDLYNIANNFGIRHHNEKQKKNYDKTIWYAWMFYYYLATIHAVTRMKEKQKS